MNEKLKQELYKNIDSFLTESKNQDGKERTLEQLNRDRYLFVENMEKVIKENEYCPHCHCESCTKIRFK